MSKVKMLRELIAEPGIIVVPGVYDCIGAKLAERVGFSCVFTSGFGIAASTLGLPDFGYLTATEMTATAGRIAGSIEIPLVADMDTGYGSPLNVMRTVRDLIGAGVAGFILEDQEWPKKCGHFEGKRVIPMEEHAEKIRAARDAAGEEPVIVARTDARAPLGLREAIRRGRTYVEAGADVLFIEAPESSDELREIAEAFPDVHLFANMVEGGKTPIIDPAELRELGFKIVVFPLTALFAATKAIEDSFRNLFERHTTTGMGKGYGLREFEELVGAGEHREVERRYSSEPK